MSLTRSQKITFILGIGALVVLMACNLTSDTTPPTLVPRASSTPPPTLGVPPADARLITPVPIQATPPAGGESGMEIASGDLVVYNLINQVNSDRLMEHVRKLEGFQTRHVNSSQTAPDRGIGAAANYIMGQFKAIEQSSGGALYTFEQPFALEAYGIHTAQRNLVAVVRGTEPGAGTLVVGAHYDSIGTPMNDGEAFAPGANDNGTGVAALIEMARILSEQQPRSSIMLVAFSAEEVGRVGSKELANWIRDSGIDLIGMINIDTIGSQEDFQGNINNGEMRIFSNGPNDNSFSRHLARVADFINFNHSNSIDMVIQDAIDREDRYGDHFSFDEDGFPAIRIMQANEAKRNADPTDITVDIEPDYFRTSVQSLLIVINSLANGPHAPRNISLQPNGNGADILSWGAVPDAVSYVISLRWPGSLIYDHQIETTELAIEWDKFRRYEGIAIAARNADGLLGPLSWEYSVRNGFVQNYSP